MRNVGVLMMGVVGMAMIAGCASSPKMMEDIDGNFNLGVYADAYNFSARMTRVRVSIDGKPAVNKAFGTGSSGHRDSHYKFHLKPGTHTISATSNKGGPGKHVTFEVKKNKFAAVYFTPGEGVDIKVSDEPIAVRPGGGV